jgi:hypothetical protein
VELVTGRVAGVCAICKTTAKPSHFHTAAHLDKARVVSKRENEQDPTLRVLSKVDQTTAGL